RRGRRGADRIGARLSIDSIAERLLRLEGRDTGIHRFVALRIAARQEQGEALHAAIAGGEYAAVRRGADADAAPSPTGAAHLPARDDRARRPARRPASGAG